MGVWPQKQTINGIEKINLAICNAHCCMLTDRNYIPKCYKELKDTITPDL